MILMWLGSFVLMVFGLVEAQRSITDIFSRWQKTSYEKIPTQDLRKTFLHTLGLSFFEASPVKSLYTGLALYNLRILNLRPAVLLMCLSTLGAWLVLFMGSLFLNFNGFFLLGICILGLLSYAVSKKFEKSLKVIFAVGIFLVGGETMLRNSSIIQTLLGQSELAFFLADGRFVAVLSIAFVGFLLGLVIRFEFWAFALGLSLLVTNTISFNGALALVMGERLGQLAVLWWRSRDLNQDCQRLGRQFAVISAAGLALGFLLAGELRSALNLGFSADMSAFQEKSLQFVALFGVMMLMQMGCQLVWGHFAGTVKVDELQDAKYFPVSWTEAELWSSSARIWAKEKVHRRLSEIRYHLAGLGSLKEGQVPEQIQNRLRDEEQQLSKVVL